MLAPPVAVSSTASTAFADRLGTGVSAILRLADVQQIDLCVGSVSTATGAWSERCLRLNVIMHNGDMLPER